MTLPYINRQVKSALRWYAREDQRTRHTKACGPENDASIDCPFAYKINSREIPSFQFVAEILGDADDATPTQWRVYSLEGALIANLDEFIPDLLLETFTNPARTYITNEEAFEHGSGWGNGLYEMEIVTPGGTYYSETMRVCGEPEELEGCMYSLTWASCGDVGTLRYSGTDFTNHMYLDPAKVEVGRPLPVFDQGEEKDGQGETISILSRKDVRWEIKMDQLPWYALDALTEIPMHTDVTLRAPGESVADTITNVVADASWPDGELCSAELVLTFQVDESTSASGCCEPFTRSCPEPCVVADGVFGEHTPELGEVFLLNRGNYGTFFGIGHPDARDEFGFGAYTTCPYRYAETTQEGFESMRWTGSSWISAITLLDVTCEDDRVFITGNAWAGFGVVVQSSEDDTVWTDLPGSYGTAELGSGFYIEPPEGCLYLRLKLVGDECTVGFSASMGNPCCIEAFDMVGGLLSGTYINRGTYEGRMHFVLEGETIDNDEPANACVWSTSSGYGSGAWIFVDGGSNVRYYSEEDVSDPTQCVVWELESGGTEPLPVLGDLYCYEGE